MASNSCLSAAAASSTSCLFILGYPMTIESSYMILPVHCLLQRLSVMSRPRDPHYYSTMYNMIYACTIAVEVHGIKYCVHALYVIIIAITCIRFAF